MLKSKTLEYYEWNDIEKYLNSKTEEDVWGIWTELFEVSNDSYLYASISDLDYKFERMKSNKHYSEVDLDSISNAIKQLRDEVGVDDIIIHYCW